MNTSRATWRRAAILSLGAAFAMVSCAPKVGGNEGLFRSVEEASRWVAVSGEVSPKTSICDGGTALVWAPQVRHALGQVPLRECSLRFVDLETTKALANERGRPVLFLRIDHVTQVDARTWIVDIAVESSLPDAAAKQPIVAGGWVRCLVRSGLFAWSVRGLEGSAT